MAGEMGGPGGTSSAPSGNKASFPSNADKSWLSIFNLYKSGAYTTDAASGLPYKSGNPLILQQDKNGKFTLVQESAFANGIRSMSPADFQIWKGILQKAGYSNVGNTISSDFVNAVLGIARDYSATTLAQFSRVIANNPSDNIGAIKPQSFQTYQQNVSTAGGGAGSTQVYRTITPKASADYLIDDTMQTLLGRSATAAEKKNFLKKLNEAENKYATRTTSGSGGQKSISYNFSPDRFATQYVLSKSDLNADLGGGLGNAQDAVDQLAHDSGVSQYLTRKTRLNLVKLLATGKINTDAVRSQMNDLATSAYPAWGDALKKNPSLTIRDLASPYLTTYANLMDTNAESVDLAKVLSLATTDNKQMSVYDFQKVVRKDPLFQKTSTAHQEAAQFGAAFARSMGVNI